MAIAEATSGETAKRGGKTREEFLTEAAEQDPLDARPWQHLATSLFRRWRAAPDPEKFRHFETCTDSILRLRPNGSLGWQTAGDRYFEAFEATDRPEDRQEYLTKAIEHYRRAVELYPNSGLCHAKLALALHAAGRWDTFREEAEKARRLDDLTPHKDKKLPKELRKEIENLYAELPRRG